MTSGRWPANVILSPSMADTLDKQSGISKSQQVNMVQGGNFRYDGFTSVEELQSAAEVDGKTPTGRSAKATYERYLRQEAADRPMRGYVDEGGASRFFLNAGYEPWELEWIIANGLTPCGQ